MYRSETLRQQIVEELENSQEPLSMRDISKLVGVPEKELVSHLEHIHKSLKNSGKRLVKLPANCRKCGFAFKDRRGFKKPSRCPSCRSEYISPPLLQIQSA